MGTKRKRGVNPDGATILPDQPDALPSSNFHDARMAGNGPGNLLSNVVDSAMKNDQAATLSSVVVSSSVTLIPSLNVAPSSTSLTSSWPLIRRQRSWAASSSL